MQPARLRSALAGIDALAFKYAALRDIFRKQREWDQMQMFVASNRFCRSHEAATLTALAGKALICVEEVAVNSIASALDQGDDRKNLRLLVERMR